MGRRYILRRAHGKGQTAGHDFLDETNVRESVDS
jgi:hypothetical protein